MSFDREKIYELLPAIHRLRDGENGGPLQALLAVIAEQVAVLEEDLAQSYDDQFIETCAEWVVPYLGDLIGYRALHGSVPGVRSPRAEVAHTIGFRRRKGTIVALEQLARDVTGWPAHAVEFFQQLATTQHLNHPRPANFVTPDLRRWEPLERLNGPFNKTAHTLDVRRISPRRGRSNIPNIGLFVWRLRAFSRTRVQPFQVDERRFFFNPLGRDTPLFTRPETLEAFSGLSTRMNVPEPISRRVLDRYFADYYGPEKSLFLEMEHPREIVAGDLSSLPDGTWAHSSMDKIVIDPVLGRLAFPSDQPAPEKVLVSYHEGFSAEIGGGEYDRSASLPTDLEVTWQMGLSDGRTPSFAEAVTAWNTQPAGTCGMLALMDSSTHDAGAAPAIQLPPGSMLLLVAAALTPGSYSASGCRPHLKGNLIVQGTGRFFLNGLLLEGSLTVEDRLEMLSVAHTTLVPTGAPSLLAAAAQIEITASMLGPLRVSSETEVRIFNSIVDAGSRSEVAFSAGELAPGGSLRIVNSTVVGKVHTARLALGSNTIFLAERAQDDAWPHPLWCEQHQSGCLRFSYVPPGSRTPRRYRCQPASEAENGRILPQFSSLIYGDPTYAQLSRRCPREIFEGADDESEMGAFHDLFEPQRLANLALRFDEYLRFGLEAGVFFAPNLTRPNL